jgi:hypothetical protein
MGEVGPRRTGRQLTAWREAPEESQIHEHACRPPSATSEPVPIGCYHHQASPVKRVFHRVLQTQCRTETLEPIKPADSARRRHGDVVTTPCRDGLP